MNFSSKIAAGGAALVLAMFGLAPAASAASPASADSTTGAHCAQRAMGPGDTVQEKPHCFSTEAGVISFLTGGRLALAPNTVVRPDNATQSAQIASAEAAANNYTLSEEYRNSGYGGDTYTFYWSFDCTSHVIAWSTMPSGWGDDIGSSHAGSNCNAIHYDNSGATPSYVPPGSSIPCPTFSSCSSMGAMNDHTSSMRWVHN